MIRESRTFRVSFFILLIAVVVSSALLDGVAYAGDADGVQGYSMRLKNKDFTNNEGGGSGGSGLVVAIPPSSKPGLQEPQLAGSSWLPTRLSVFAQLELGWIWMMLRR
jgi:hypothetical protein